MTSEPALNSVHFVAIGGSVMHNLALALHHSGVRVSGSDDEIREPSRGRLARYGLLPESPGWHPERLSSDLDAVIVGMHARPDNPELARARELGLTIYSFPEFIYAHAHDKQRIVIAGSHGKTTITAMIMHVLGYHGYDFDYVVGAQLEGFETMVKLSDAPVIVIEGDEYLTSPLDPTPKFLHYHHHIGLISGVAWDHMNVFPTIDEYVRQFDRFADQTPKAGSLIFCEEDDITAVVCKKERPDVTPIEYTTHRHEVTNGQTYLLTEQDERVAVPFFGQHNLQNVSGARTVCQRIGVTPDMFYAAIGSFRGASQRLELVAESGGTRVFRDFAHAPSKLVATVQAVRTQYPNAHLVAVVELHTFSSLNKEFLKQYRDTLRAADDALVYYNPAVVAHKQLDPIDPAEIKAAFQQSDLRVFTNRDTLREALEQLPSENVNLLLMSSGHFDGLDVSALAGRLAGA